MDTTQTNWLLNTLSSTKMSHQVCTTHKNKLINLSQQVSRDVHQSRSHVTPVRQSVKSPLLERGGGRKGDIFNEALTPTTELYCILLVSCRWWYPPGSSKFRKCAAYQKNNTVTSIPVLLKVSPVALHLQRLFYAYPLVFAAA